ncbi:MAG TPA: hypothetical protein VMB46_01805 [Methanomassiliicoccales archaeon]|nr:hypothetical protein [Methanomassiliicoccales archaeon]
MVSIVFGVAFTILEIRHLNRVRRTEIIMRIYERFGTKEMVEAVNRVGAAEFVDLTDYRNRYGFTDITQLAVLFDGVGALLEQGLIDIKMVDDLFGPTLNLLWVRVKPVIYAMRIGLNEAAFFSHFEFLVKRLEAYRLEKGQAA